MTSTVDIKGKRPCSAEKGRGHSQPPRLHRKEPRALGAEGFLLEEPQGMAWSKDSHRQMWPQ